MAAPNRSYVLEISLHLLYCLLHDSTTYNLLSVKVTGKSHPITGHVGLEWEQMYSSTLPLTLALDGGVWSTPSSGRFTPGKDPVQIIQEAEWAPGPVWTGAENLASAPGFDPRTVQSVASRYTDLAIAAPIC
jgi:hypothetical protein